MRVLIVRLGAFGDIIHTLPLAADLHAAGHQVDWLCEDRWAILLEGSPALQQVHTLPRKQWKQTKASLGSKFSDARDLIRRLRGQRYDAAIDAQGLAKSAIFTACSGAALRLGHARPRARELSWLTHHISCPVDATHVIDQQRRLGLGLCGERYPGGRWRFPLPAWPEAQAWADSYAADKDLNQGIILNVGAGWPTKVWPQERQIAFAQACQEADLGVHVVWGSPAEREVADAICAAVPSASLCPPTNLPQLAMLLSRARGMVSGDTGPLHMALAVNCPAVGLFGPVPGERNGPRGPGYRFLQAPGAAWERKDVSKVNMGAIAADSVLQALQEAMQEVSA